jgi:peptide/nickel transport system ATP-binding protein
VRLRLILNDTDGNMSQEPLITCESLVKIYKVAELEVVALQGLDLEVQRGEMMSLVGVSGSGKSTLLNVIGGLDAPSAGKVTVNGHQLLHMSERERVHYKRETVGFVWQQPGRNLLPYLNALENVTLPMLLTKEPSTRRRDRAMRLLELLGLAERANHKPDALSGGEQQRVALAIALANDPPLLLADELTGQLDSVASEQLFDSLRELNQSLNTTIVVVTHDPRVAAKVDRVVSIRDGRTSTEIRRARSAKDGSMSEEEWVILDRSGRMQLPQVYLDTLAMQGRVKARLEPDHVSIWPTKGLDTISAAPTDLGKVWRPERRFTITADKESNAEAQPAAVVGVHRLWRTFHTEVEEIHAIQNLTLSIPRGDLSVIKGRSGSGKTTLINLMGGLDEPTRGEIVFDGDRLVELSEKEKTELRRAKIGFVFQNFGLLPSLTARENIEAPLRLLLVAGSERRRRTDEVLSLVGLTDRAEHRTHELSGGEQQRVALARALVARPTLILADEPTGQLDTVTGSNIIALLKDISEQTGISIVVASHDPKVEEAADHVFELHDGQLVRKAAGTVN